jgi:hypothetical protein
MGRDKIRHVDLRPDEFIAGTFGVLSPLQFAVHWAACLMIYSRGGPVDDDADRLAAAFKAPSGRMARQPTLYRAKVRVAVDELVAMGKLTRTQDGRLANGRAEDELARASNRIEKARLNGSKGGRPRLTGDSRETHRRLTGNALHRSNSNGLVKPEALLTLKPLKESLSSEISTVAARARELTPAGLAPAHDDGPDPVTQVARAFTRHAKPVEGPGVDRPAERADVERLIAELGVDPATVDTPPPPNPPAATIVTLDAEPPPSLADLAAAHRRRFMGGG